MRKQIAQQRYQQRHIEPEMPRLRCGHPQWRYALVIPVYRESPSLLLHLNKLAKKTTGFLAILALNRPDNDTNFRANDALRRAVQALPPANISGDCADLYKLHQGSALLLCDTENSRGPLPASKGVGLARKIGCDVAWQLCRDGAIEYQWIFSSDADARLPEDYFRRAVSCDPQVTAVTYPFVHVAGPEPDCNDATALYELHLHHYVLGLEYAGSPYAYHTLGSSLAVKAEAYAKVRGFPQRAGGEDFYLLNKIRKLGPIARLGGQCIELLSRESQRTPFGTGPAVARIADTAGSPALFYHPLCYLALRVLLKTVSEPDRVSTDNLSVQLEAAGIPRELCLKCITVLEGMGWEKALLHCNEQARSHEGFQRHFHQWFDAFRTLKFIHALRDNGLPRQNLAALKSLAPILWPPSENGGEIVTAIHDHWGWTTNAPPANRRNPHSTGTIA